MSKEYIRTDRNGTKIYHDYTCPKCHGTGHIHGFEHIDGGVCFKCGGYGQLEKPRVYKEYTPEYAAKMEARREARWQKKVEAEKAKAAETNTKFYEGNGFSPEGKTYIVIGDTYEIKEELKAMGAKWDKFLNNTAGYGWRLPQDTDKYPTVEADVSELYFSTIYGTYDRDNWKATPELFKKLEDAVEQKNREDNTSEYVGEIKQRLDLELTYTGHASWDNPYSYGSRTYLYKFKDADENQLIWKTSKYIGELLDDSEKIVTVKATIKDHTEYNGVKQTVLTRCKVLV